MFASVADVIRRIRLDERCVTVGKALGHLHRSVLSASTAILDNGATSLLCGHLTLLPCSHELVTAGFYWRTHSFSLFASLPVWARRCVKFNLVHTSPCLLQKQMWLSPGAFGSWRHSLVVPSPLLELFGVKIYLSSEDGILAHMHVRGN